MASGLPEPEAAGTWDRTVIRRALSDTDGNLAAIRLDKGIRELNPAAMAAVRCWKYLRARRAGRPVETWLSITVALTIN